MQASRPSRVDFPEPDGPAITVSRWPEIVTSTPSTASTGPVGAVEASGHAPAPRRPAARRRAPARHAVARITSIGRARTTPTTPITVSRPRASDGRDGEREQRRRCRRRRAPAAASWRRVSSRGTASRQTPQAERGAQRDAGEQRQGQLGEHGERLVADPMAHAPGEDERRLPWPAPCVEHQELGDEDDDGDEEPERGQRAVGPAHGQEAGDLEHVGLLAGAADGEAGGRQLVGGVGRRAAGSRSPRPGRACRPASGVAVHDDEGGAVAVAGEEVATCWTGSIGSSPPCDAAQLRRRRAGGRPRSPASAPAEPSQRISPRASREGAARGVAPPAHGRGRRSPGRRRAGRRRSLLSAGLIARRSWPVRPDRRGSGATPSVLTTRSAPRNVAALSCSVLLGARRRARWPRRRCRRRGRWRPPA